MSWLTDWKYYKPITVSNASADYQTKLSIYTGAGVDGTNIAYCNNHIAADFDDLRFTRTDGTTLLDYWIESVVADLATVWVENNSGTPDTALRMYYGGTETAVSSGANTFIVFDNFERGVNGDSIGGAWSEPFPHVNISTDHAYGGTRSAIALSQTIATIPVTASANVAIRFRYWKEAAAAANWYHGDATTQAVVYIAASSLDLMYYDTAGRDTGANITADAWQLLELCNFNFTTDTYDIYSNDVLAKSAAAMNTGAASSGLFRLYGNGASAGMDSYLDNFIVRKWAATEPSFAFGSEVANDWANISKINGIASSSIIKVDGVNTATLSKVNGVAV